jgi:hypothetical protein
MSKDSQIKVTTEAKDTPLPEAIADKMCEISQGLPDPGGKVACALRALAEEVRGLQGSSAPPAVIWSGDATAIGLLFASEEAAREFYGDEPLDQVPVQGARQVTAVPPTVWVETGPHIQPGEITVYVNNDAAIALGRVSDGFVAPVKGDPTKRARTVSALPPEVHVAWGRHGAPFAACVDNVEAQQEADGVVGGRVSTMRLRGAPGWHPCWSCENIGCSVSPDEAGACTHYVEHEDTVTRLRRERDEARATTEAIKTDKNDLVDALTKANKVIEQVDDALRPLLAFLPGQFLVSIANAVAGRFRGQGDTLKAARGTLREALDTTEPLSVSELAGLAALRLRDCQQDRDRARAECTDAKRLLVDQIGAHNPETLIDTATRAAGMLATWRPAAGQCDEPRRCANCQLRALGTCINQFSIPAPGVCGDWKPITPDPVGDALAPMLLARVAVAVGHLDPTPAELLGLADEVRDLGREAETRRVEAEVQQERVERAEAAWAAARKELCGLGDVIRRKDDEIAGLLVRGGDVDDERQRWKARYEMAERWRLEAEELVKSFGDERDALKAKLEECGRANECHVCPPLHCSTFCVGLPFARDLKAAMEDIRAHAQSAVGMSVRLEPRWREVYQLADHALSVNADRWADDADDCAECEKAMEEMRASLAIAQQERAAAMDLAERSVNHAGDAIRERNEAREALTATTCEDCDGTGWISDRDGGDLCRCPLGENLGRAHCENDRLRKTIRDLRESLVGGAQAAELRRWRNMYWDMEAHADAAGTAFAGVAFAINSADPEACPQSILDALRAAERRMDEMEDARRRQNADIVRAHAEAVDSDPSMGKPTVLNADQDTKRPMAKAGDDISESLSHALSHITRDRIGVEGLLALLDAVIAMDERERRESHNQDLILRRLELVEERLASRKLVYEVHHAVQRVERRLSELERRQSDKAVVESEGHRREYDVSKVEVTCAGVKVDPCGDVLVFPPESCVGCPWYWTNPAVTDGRGAVCGNSRPPGPRLVNPTPCERHPDWPSKGSGGDGQ